MTTTIQAPTQDVPAPKGGVARPVYEDGTWTPKAWTQSYVGAVLAKFERSDPMDSYDSIYYAVVYDEATNSLKHVDYLHTRGGHGVATVDATDEVKTKAREVVYRWQLEKLASEAAATAKVPERGKTVRVTKAVRGKNKVEVGTTGTVFWKGEDKYSPRPQYGMSPTYRLGVKTLNGQTVWLNSANVSVVDPEDYMPAWSRLEQRARQWADGDHWGL